MMNEEVYAQQKVHQERQIHPILCDIRFHRQRRSFEKANRRRRREQERPTRAVWEEGSFLTVGRELSKLEKRKNEN